MIEYLESIGLSIEDIYNITNNYNKSFILSLDLDNFKQVVNLLQLYFKKDIVNTFIKENIEIFTYPTWFIKKNISNLSNKNDYLEIIEENPELLYQEKEVNYGNN